METTGGHFLCLAFSAVREELHPTDKACGEEQAGMVDMDGAVFIDEAVFVEFGEFVVFNMAVLVGFLCKSALDDGAEERGSVLHGQEKGTLSQLCLRPTVVDMRWLSAAEGLAEAGVIDAVADGA